MEDTWNDNLYFEHKEQIMQFLRKLDDGSQEFEDAAANASLDFRDE